MTRSIWVVRHAKSDWSDGALSDFERPLNARGQRDCEGMQPFLRAQNLPAQGLWHSPAVRAAATAAAVARGFAIDPSQVVEADLYLASAAQALECLRATPPDIDHVAVVFHNPGASELAQRLLQEPAEINMPTFGIAHVTFDGPWASLAFGQATVQQITSPKALKRHHDQESP